MDHYATLGVAKSATPDEIKKAYRKLASKHHPDKGGDTATFQKIEEAYRILSDTQQRQQYDNPMPQGFGQNFNFFCAIFFLGNMLHQNHHMLHAGYQVHSAAHAFDHFSRNHPVCKIPMLTHLHSAQDSNINLATTNHAK